MVCGQDGSKVKRSYSNAMLYLYSIFFSLGPYFVGVTHSFNAENSPKCFRTQLVKSLGEDDVGSGLFRCSTRDSNQSFWDLPTVFYCCIRLLNNAGIVWMDGRNPMKSAPSNISRFEKSHNKAWSRMDFSTPEMNRPRRLAMLTVTGKENHHRLIGR